MYNLTWGVSNAVAFFVAPVLFRMSWVWIFLGSAAGCLVGALTIFRCAIPQAMIAPHHVPDDKAAAADAGSVARDVERNKTLLHMAWVANAVAYAAINVLIPVLPTVVLLAGATGALAQSVLIFVWTFTRAVGFAIVWRWTGWAYSVRWLMGAFVALALTFVLMLAWPANIPLLLGAEAVFGLAAALLYSASLYYAMQVSSGDGGHAGVHESLVGLGIAVGPAIAALAGTSGVGGGSAGMGHIAPGIIVGVTCVLTAGLAALGVMGAKAAKRTSAYAGVEGRGV
jgi:hypothetical protein